MKCENCAVIEMLFEDDFIFSGLESSFEYQMVINEIGTSRDFVSQVTTGADGNLNLPFSEVETWINKNHQYKFTFGEDCFVVKFFNTSEQLCQ